MGTVCSHQKGASWLDSLTVATSRERWGFLIKHFAFGSIPYEIPMNSKARLFFLSFLSFLVSNPAHCHDE